MRFIAIDPSAAMTGWAAFEDAALIAWGTIDTSKQAYGERFGFIVAELKTLADRYGIQGVAIEETKFAWTAGGQRQRNISGMQVVFKTIKDWATGRRLKFSPYNVATWKNNIVGNVHASKEQTAACIGIRVQGIPADLNDHEYDAIAIGLNHAAIMEMRKRDIGEK